MSAGIPDPGGVSGTFAALERSTPIVQSSGGVLTTTSMRIANGTETQHKNVLELIRSNLADFDEFGLVAFETRPRPAGQHGGGDVQVAILTEEHATLLLTYMRNSAVVRDFKKRLVREFWELRRQAASPATAMPTHSEALRGWATELERADAAVARVAELEPSAVAWDRLQELGADYEVADAAKILSRDPNIEIGRNRLFEFMHDQDWIFRGRHNCWKAYQEQVDLGRLKHRPGGEYFHKPSGEYRTGDPTILITPKGLADLRRLLGGGPALVAVS